MPSCPSCGNQDLRRLDYDEGAIHLCGRCRLQFAQYRPAQAGRGVTVRQSGLLRSTGDRYMDPASLGDPGQYPPYREFFQRVEKLLGPAAGLRILDVGCGNGVFLRHCLELGRQAYGVEINTELKALMPAEIAARVAWDSAENLEGLPLDQFDLITFWDSFEHMEDGFAVLEGLRPRLAPGGAVYVRVNNNRDIFNLLSLLALRLHPALGKAMLKNCFGFPAHLWNFSLAGMRNLASRHGWQVVDHSIGETPASRLAPNLAVQAAIQAGYLVNRLMGGGKIGNYYLRPDGNRV